MMTLEELRATPINEQIAREAYQQATTRLDDILATSTNYEQKAYALFGGYLTAALALFGVAAAGLQEADEVGAFGWLLFAGGGLFTLAAFLCAFALIDADYGTRGSSPDMWLTPDVIGGANEALPLMLAYITHHHKRRIDASIRGNSRKARLIRFGLILGASTPPLLGAVAVFLALKGLF